MPGPVGILHRFASAAAALMRKPGTPTPVPPVERQQRAMAALRGPRLTYCLGAGGRGEIAGDYVPYRGEPPSSIAARRARGRVYVDCSGGVAGALGIQRHIRGYARGWDYFSTDGVICDADDPAVEIVRWVEIGEAIEPWTAIAVYGSLDTDGDGDRDVIGHMGLVSSVEAGWTFEGPASIERLGIWHCAASRHENGACRITSGAPWARRGRLALVL